MLRSPLLLPAALLFVACTSSTGEETALDLSNSTTKQLATPIPVPKGTPIGKSMEGFIDEFTRGLSSIPGGTVPEGCSGTSFRNRANQEQAHVVRCPDFVGLFLYDGETHAPRGSYSDGPLKDPEGGLMAPPDGKVDTYHQAEGEYLAVLDSNRDGRVDEQIIEAFWGEPEEVCHSLRPYTTRTLVDADHDGMFETEALFRNCNQ